VLVGSGFYAAAAQRRAQANEFISKNPRGNG